MSDQSHGLAPPQPDGSSAHTGALPASSLEAQMAPSPLRLLLEAVDRACQNERPLLDTDDLEIMPRASGDAPVLWGLGDEAAETLPPAMLARLRLRPSASISELLSSVERQSRSARVRLAIHEVGVVRQVGDGVASVWGLPQATTDELVLFTNGVQGLVMNLDTVQIDSILLGPDAGIQGGDTVWATGRRIMVPVGDRLLGRVINPLGEPLDGKGALFVDERRFIERQAPGVVERAPVSVPLHTGIKAVDALIPIGRGQRELIIGDRQTGKTSIALDTIINQRDTDVICIYVSIGQRKSSVLQVLRILQDADAMDHTIVMMAAPDDPPALVYLAPYAGITVAESFLDRGHDVLIVYDDLTKHADAYRELSLLLRRPPGREAYPGDVFYLHARLLERACRLSDEQGGGSITALPIVETRRGNISAYIPTNLISITDGQIYVSAELFNENIKPGIDVGLSVSRVGGAAQTQIMRRVSGQLRLTLSQYQEVAHFSRFGTEIDRATRQQIIRGERLREVLNQPPYQPLPLARQVLILRAVDLGYLDEIPVSEIARYERELWEYAQQEHRGLIRDIEEELHMTPAIEQELRQVIEGLAERFT